MTRPLLALVLLAAGCGNMPEPPPAGGAAAPPATTRSPPWADRQPVAASANGPGASATLATPPPMTPGGRQPLLAGTAGRAFQWGSSNPAVAAVDTAGVVHAVGPGSATITATRVKPDGSTETISTAVTVRGDPVQETGRGHRFRRR